MPPQQQPNWSQHSIQDNLKASFTELLLTSYAGYDRLMRVGAARKILEGMMAKELYSPGRLKRMMQLINNSQQIGQLRTTSNLNSTEVFDFYQTLGALLKVEKTCRTLLQEFRILRSIAISRFAKGNHSDLLSRKVRSARKGVRGLS